MPSHSVLALASREWVNAHLERDTLAILHADTASACIRAEAWVQREDLNQAKLCSKKVLLHARTRVSFLADLFFDLDGELAPKLAAAMCIWNSIYRVCRAWAQVDSSEARRLAAHAYVYHKLLRGAHRCGIRVDCRRIIPRRSISPKTVYEST